MMGALFDTGALALMLAATVRLAVPIGFAALGGMIAERSGVYNVGLEGMMLLGALGAAGGTLATGSPIAGCLVGVALGLAAGLLLGLLCITFHVNQLVAGIAINLLSAGLTAFLARGLIATLFGTSPVEGFSARKIPGLAELPIIGPAFFAQDPLAYALMILTVFVAFLVFRTHAGLSLRAAGESPRAADSSGVDVPGVRFAALAGSGALAALGGCHLVLCQIYLFSEGMSAGKGFIALAAVILGRWHPVGAVAAALFFGLCEALQLRLQFSNPTIPYQIFLILPYAASLIVLVWFFGRSRQPAAAGQVYERESR
jgi:ABC-type uncharacterized transport system permease subunit